MNDFLHCKQCVVVLQTLRNLLVGVVCAKSCEIACVGCLHTVLVNRHKNLKQILVLRLHADLKVLHTEAGCCMNAARAAFKRNMVAVYNN